MPVRRSRRGFLVLMFAAFCLLVGLGTWQLDRLKWKEALIDERQTMLGAPPVAVASLAAGAEAAPYRRVRLSGAYLHEKELLVGPRTRHGAAGWHVITPLRFNNGGFVLINRGWIPRDRRNPASRVGGQLAGAITVEGFLKRPSRRGPFVPDNDPANGQWFDVDPAAMAKHLKLSPIAPYWVVAGPASHPGGYPKSDHQVSMPPNNHLQYAGTWYGLALVVAVCSIFYWRRV